LKSARTLVALALVLTSWTAARSARACGGTFCDTGPRAMPVDQKGENILFVMSSGQVEAHIQIQYNGDAARFAWVLPVPALPEVEVGSEALFQSLLLGTVPRFGLNTTGCGGGTIFSTGTGGGRGPPAVDGGGDGTTIVVQKTVGSFDVTVLKGGSAAEVSSWLDANGYAIGPDVPPLLEGYVAEKFFFVAVKLTGGAGIDQIHPLVVRYTGTDPCVPLRLTAVAAIEDMGVRTFFLGSRRVVPKSYKHVVFNPVMLNWYNLAPNYEDVITQAADAPVANGHAFVTEYAGNSSVVSRTGLVSQRWTASVFVNADPTKVIDLLSLQGLVALCGGGTCTYTHALILPLLREFLPAPPGVDEGGFYDCLACYAKDIDRVAWGDGTGFARALEERVIVPGRHANDLLDANPYLTRMYTTISPAEMSEDPTFEETDGLPPVGTTQTATALTSCDGKTGVILPDGREVGLDRVTNPSSPSAVTVKWPTFRSEMPWVERVEELGGSTGPIVLVDNSATIDRLLKEWNDSIGWIPGGLDAGGGGAGGGPGAGGGLGASGGFAGAGTGGGSPKAGDWLTVTGGGCGCAVPGTGKPVGPLSGWLVALAFALARRFRTRECCARLVGR